ncbi:MAG: glycosyl hydrolase 53 family protein [Bacteroidales bacterium]|nr:glycosyl hydrolase 53 family protein [Bacteroidales bacterium]
MSLNNTVTRVKQALIILATPCLLVLSCSQKKSEPDPVKEIVTVPYAWDKFSMGVDLSYVNEIEDYGGVYSDSGKIADPFLIMKNHGANTVRVRLWHNPAWVSEITGGKLYSDLYDVEKTIRRAKDAGMAVNLNLHYSDTWADPNHQETPATWVGLDPSALKDSVYNYTLKILNYLKSKGLTPEMVQVGNETNPGMLFPVGEVKNDNWLPFGALLNAGIKAVRDFSASSEIKPKIILHVAQFQHATWWIEGVVKKGKVTDFDILGVSHYSKWSTFYRMDQVTQAIQSIRATYNKQVMIVETAYPWTGSDADEYANIIGQGDSIRGYPLTVAGQSAYLKDLTQAIVDGGGTGIMYWEPGWITSPMRDKWGTGSAWDNCTLFDFSGNILPSADYMNTSYDF